MAQPHQSQVRNRLLRALHQEDFARLASSLEPITLVMRDRLIGPQKPIAGAYFIEDGLISLIADTDGGRIEIGMVGREGFIGTSLVLGTDRTPHVAIVQAEGTAWRVTAEALQAAGDASASLRMVLGRYIQSLIIQVGQTVYANAELNVEGRLARWILMTHDRLGRDELPMTHEFLAMMLAVRRPGVTNAIHALEGTGTIRAFRGRITVLDREKLKEMAGDTYGRAEEEYERLLAEA